MQAHALLSALCCQLLLLFVHSRVILLTRWVVGGFVPALGQLVLNVLCSIIARFGCVHPISPSPSPILPLTPLLFN